MPPTEVEGGPEVVVVSRSHSAACRRTLDGLAVVDEVEGTVCARSSLTITRWFSPESYGQIDLTRSPYKGYKGQRQGGSTKTSVVRVSDL